MRSLRRGFQRWVRRLGPALVLVSALVLVGFGTHAALDWHHHGATGMGFFHLHAHVGHHHHGARHDHHHGEQDPHKPDRSDPTSPFERQDETFTVAFGVAPAPALAAVEAPSADSDGRQDPWSPILIANELTDQPWIPRGPPV